MNKHLVWAVNVSATCCFAMAVEYPAVAVAIWL